MWIAASLVLLVLLGLAVKKLLETHQRAQELAQTLEEHEQQFGPVADAQRQLHELTQALIENKRELRTLRTELEPLQRQEALFAAGFTPVTYEFPDSESYQRELEKLRDRQKQLILDDRAVDAPDLTLGNSAKDGQRVARDLSRMMLRAFNGECDALTARVSYKNYESSKKRMQSCYDQLNKLGKTLQLSLTSDFLNLRLRELELVYQYLEIKYEEAEEQKAIRERIREEERATREYQRAREDAEQDERRWLKALRLAESQLAASHGKLHSELAVRVAELQAQLKTAQEAKQRAISMAEKTRAGHVYVISNVGSFGDAVVKVGMTRRLDPQERVDELGSASVPFRFDVHAMIYSEDAPALEHKLHTALAGRRVNKVNERKEFFEVSLDEIEALVNKFHGRFTLTRAAEAKEYRETKALLLPAPAVVAAVDRDFRPTSFARQPAAAPSPSVRPRPTKSAAPRDDDGPKAVKF